MYILDEINNTIIIEKSRFICYMKHVKDEQEYKEYLAQIRKKHYDASHVCSAFICHNIRRSSDDGEPSGTAGVPILNVLDKNDLDEMCALVVRYFGGIKLGAGGLVRAYGKAVSECLKNAVLYEDITYPLYEITVTYETANRLDNYLRNHAVFTETAYDENVTYHFSVEDEKQLQSIIELTKGTIPGLIGEKTLRKVVK